MQHELDINQKTLIIADVNNIAQSLTTQDAQQAIGNILDQNLHCFMINNISKQRQVYLGGQMKQKVSIAWKKHQKKRYYCFKLWRHNPIALSKEFSPQELASLSNSDSNFDSSTSHNSMVQSNVKHKTFQSEDIVSKQNVSSKTPNQVELAFERYVNFLFFHIFTWKKKRQFRKLNRLVL